MINETLNEEFEYIIKDKNIPFELLRGKKVLITGATGLIGSLFVKFFLHCNREYDMNIKMFAIIRNEKKAEDIFGTLKNIPDVEFLIVDFVNGCLDIEEVDYIIHGAANTNSKYMVSNPVETLLTDLKGTENMLEIAVKNRVQGMVYLSSMEVYGSIDQIERVKEKDLGYIDTMKVRSSYPIAKRTCECLCYSYFNEYGLKVKIARLAQTFGVGVSLSDTRVFAQFAKSIINEKDIVLKTDGSSYGNYCYTIDVLRGILYILLKGRDGEAYNVVNEETSRSIKEMAEMVVGRFGKNNKVCIDIPDESQEQIYAPKTGVRLSSEKLNSLGWYPKYNLEQMYEKLIDYFRLMMN